MSNYSGMDHSVMDHGSMDHGMMDHDSMDHSKMDHSMMMDNGHSAMDHNGMMKVRFSLLVVSQFADRPWSHPIRILHDSLSFSHAQHLS